jgi:hypothetical protein
MSSDDYQSQVANHTSISDDLLMCCLISCEPPSQLRCSFWADICTPTESLDVDHSADSQMGVAQRMQNIMGDPPIGCQADDVRPVNCRTFEVEAL